MENKTIIAAFEGIDGSGKSVQFQRLKAYWETQGKRVGILDFPDYSSFFGKEIGTLLSGKESVTAAELDPRSMSLWYAADRWKAFQGFETGQYDMVLMNRSTMANAAYQGVRSSDPEAFINWVFELEFQQLGIPLPDLFFIFDIPVSLSQKNVAKKGFRSYVGDEADVYEKDLAFLEQVRSSYLTCAKIFPSSQVIRCFNEDSEMRTVEEIASDVLQRFQGKFPELF